MLGWTNPRLRVWVWMVAELSNLGHWDCSPQVRGRVSSCRPMSSGSGLPRGLGSAVFAEVSRERHGQPTQGQWRAESAQRSPWISTHCSYGPLLYLRLWIIHTDPTCSRNMSPDLTLGRSTGMDVTMGLWWQAGHRISLFPTTLSSSDFSKAREAFCLSSLPFSHHESVHPNAPKECGCLPPASTVRT